MGRMLGAFDADSDSSRSDLNLCPDCGCYFPQDTCPLCGKECPEEFRAGNRKPVKQKKTKRSGGSGRVTFVEWYHSWWVIALALLFAPILGIILLFTSPHKKSLKIGLIVAAILYSILSTYGVVLLSQLSNLFEKPVDTSLSITEYTERCEEVDAEAYYRTPDVYKDQYIRMNLVVVQKLVDTNDSGKYSSYYLCKDFDGNSGFSILIRDCVIKDRQNYLPGDLITVFGEGAASRSVLDELTWENYSAPCVHAAYIAPIKAQ